MSSNEQPTDILRLFREDLDPSDRVDAFRVASEQLADQVDEIATLENVSRINENYDITFIFNSHGDLVHVAQSMEAMGNPFITFVENAGDTDIAQSGVFGYSVNNAFEITFNGAAPNIPPFNAPSPQDFGYWRDRGLLAKGSLIAPVDIRHYSKRLLDALMGNDYDQQFLNRSVPGYELRQKEFSTLVEEQQTRGELVMYSNAVRELTSTKQVLETLLQVLDTQNGHDAFGTGISDKVRALAQKARLSSDSKIPVAILYGTGHHSMMHVYRKLGIECDREFPGKVDIDGALKFHGSILDQFFSAHPFGLGNENKHKYAQQLVLEGMLWDLVNNPVEYGLVPSKRSVAIGIWKAIHRAARDRDSLDGIEEIHRNYQTDPHTILPLLEKAGIRLTKI